MPADLPRRFWFSPALNVSAGSDGSDTREFTRMWQGFMLARFTLALVLLLLHLALSAWGLNQSRWLLPVSMVFFASTLASWQLERPKMLGSTFTGAWARLVGLDLLAITTLQYLQGFGVNYTPLFGLPVLLASVLGSLQLALGTAAGVSMLLLGVAIWGYSQGRPDAASALAQAALTGVGYFAIAMLAHQLATRLANVGQSARRNQLAAHVQRQVNELVIESMPHGVMIVDPDAAVLGANPAAREMLHASDPNLELPRLSEQAAWAELWSIAKSSLERQQSQEQEVTIAYAGQGPRRVRVRTRLTDPLEMGGDILCVLFLQDQRELEARLRTEKLASMGRMSTAVAHDIRNPLAAITQANALLEEELEQPRQRRLTQVVGQNAQRLSRMVDDILNATRVRSSQDLEPAAPLALNDSVLRCCRDWAAQNQCEHRLGLHLCPQPLMARFDSHHLRRVLVNLLDNALHHSVTTAHGMQVHLQWKDATQHAELEVWSDSPPMDQSVQRHLFEPFFSSESRSNGLGLYICRELCESHGASIGHERRPRPVGTELREGNAFVVKMPAVAVHSASV